MKRIALALALSLSTLPVYALDGVTPYLPLNLEPEIERQVQRVLILANKPTLTRPIAAATVLDALPKACTVDAKLCEQVRRYLRRYMHGRDIGYASVELALSSGSDVPLPNRHGLDSGDSWTVAAGIYVQPSDYLILSLGGMAYDGETLPENSMLSLGFSVAQLDIGYRAHWLSPTLDSSLLIGTEAPAIPSVTLSNYQPLTRLGIHYEAFAAELSHSDSIYSEGVLTSGKPRLTGLHLSMEPVSGWAVGVNRLMQYGGGGRGGNSLSDVFNALLKPAQYDNIAVGETDQDKQFGNQLASLTSQMVFPGRHPFTVYFEYGGEDTSKRNNFILGNTALSAGIRFPQLTRHLDLTLETSEWQNGWYVNGLYGDGLRNKDRVLGHWFGDQRVFSDDVEGRSYMAQLGWEPKFGGTVQFRARSLQNETYNVAYKRGYDLSLSYSRQLTDFLVGAEAIAGRDVFGDSYTRVGTFFRYAPEGNRYPVRQSTDVSDVDSGTEFFVDAGVNAYEMRLDLIDDLPIPTTDITTAPHVAIGARRPVSKRQDLGVRVEMDRFEGNLFLAVRALDYRYRFASNPLAITAFIGAASYQLGTPAQGMYYGAGVQWRDILKKWDLGLEYRFASDMARDNTLPTDRKDIRDTSFYDITSFTLSLSRRF